MSEIVPFQTGMTLGRTYDLRTMSVGSDIFTEKALAALKTTEIPESDYRYYDIKNCKDVNKALGIKGEFALKVKAGLANADVAGKYLKQDRSTENTIDILTTAHVKMVEETMASTDLNPDLNINSIGTHFIRTIKYGGNMFANIRIQASDSTNVEDIRGQVSAGMSFEGALDANAKAELKMLEKDIRGSSSMQISLYATILIDTVPRDIASMLKTLDAFNDEVKKEGNGKGVPLMCELVPLSTLDPSIPEVVRNRGVDAALIELEVMYDDVRHGKSKLETLLGREDLTDDQEKQAWKLNEKISTLYTCFNTVIAKLDVTKEPDQLTPAFDAYSKNTEPGGYTHMVSQFEKSLKA
ncbi:stonustoxin subunit alpha-like [Haliotis rubra]|uniref:stonustoxin subunit alpha-like n=1 Tax=Haliotis rubra TaxID=36100 RepID=UPI001EE4F252|nr:stonustoxin subunit alpha-like [Haliotis rubra]